MEGIPWLAAEFEDANVSISNGSVDAVFGYKAGIEEILEVEYTPYQTIGKVAIVGISWDLVCALQSSLSKPVWVISRN